MADWTYTQHPFQTPPATPSSAAKTGKLSTNFPQSFAGKPVQDLEVTGKAEAMPVALAVLSGVLSCGGGNFLPSHVDSPGADSRGRFLQSFLEAQT